MISALAWIPKIIATAGQVFAHHVQKQLCRPPQRLLFCPNLDGSDVDEEILSHTMTAVEQIRAAGVDVVETGPVMPEVFSPFLLLFFGNMVVAYRELLGTDAMHAVTPSSPTSSANAAERVTADTVEEARRPAQTISIELAETMAGFDALISPVVVGHTPFSEQGGVVNGEEVLGWVGNTYGLDAAGRPATRPSGSPTTACRSASRSSATTRRPSHRRTHGLGRGPVRPRPGRPVPVMSGVQVVGHDHVVFLVADIERSLAFYRDRLGLPTERGRVASRRRPSSRSGSTKAR